MSAEVLRDAARLMRERAAASRVAANEDWWGEEGLLSAFDALWNDDDGPGLPGAHADAEHIASWHPDVALAVAAWLDACALVEEVAPTKTKANALAVAPAYLGESA